MVWLSLISYLWPYWRDLYLAIGISGVVLLVISWYILPESPRWLIVKQRFMEAEIVLEKIATGIVMLYSKHYKVMVQKVHTTLFK